MVQKCGFGRDFGNGRDVTITELMRSYRTVSRLSRKNLYFLLFLCFVNNFIIIINTTISK